MQRVYVKAGDGKTEIGYGNIVDNVTVYIIRLPDGNITSRRNAEEEPHPSEVPSGATVIKSDDNPKIVLDDGQTFYGCQVWWSPVKRATHPTKAREGWWNNN